MRDPSRRRELILLALLALPMVLVMPFLHPAQGLIRDWDNFMMAGVACSLLVAVVTAEIVRGTPRWAWLGVAVSLAAALPTIQLMLHHTDAERGMARMHAFVSEPPARPEAERAMALDFLGIRYLRQRQPVRAAEVFRQAVELAPSPRLHIQWALAETQAGNYRGAMEVYERLIAKSPSDPVAWRGYTAMASRLGLWPEAKRGAEQLLKLVPGDPEARALIDRIDAAGLTE
jgi:Flp pilus assembly protein TadD